MKLGYTDFINKHKTLFFSMFILFVLIYLLIPNVNFDNSLGYISTYNKSSFSLSPIYLFITCFRLPNYFHNLYVKSEYAQQFNLSYKEFHNDLIRFYCDAILSSIFVILILISIIIIIVLFCKKKRISKLIVIPYIAMIFYNIAMYIFYSITYDYLKLTPLNLIITLIFSIPVFLYCLNFQRIGKTREHKLTDKERIAELEKRITELEGKDVK